MLFYVRLLSEDVKEVVNIVGERYIMKKIMAIILLLGAISFIRCEYKTAEEKKVEDCKDDAVARYVVCMEVGLIGSYCLQTLEYSILACE
jgi:hypothetical protein